MNFSSDSIPTIGLLPTTSNQSINSFFPQNNTDLSVQTLNPQQILQDRAHQLANLRTNQWSSSYLKFGVKPETIPNLKGTLVRTKVDKNSRAQMVDWMFEVLKYLQKPFSVQTYFKSILLMDLVFLRSKKKVQKKDIHIIGLTSMVLASKFEDVWLIKLSKMVAEAAPGKFTNLQIEEFEIEILSTIDYEVSLKTTFEIFEFYFFEIFGNQNDLANKSLKKIGVEILVLCTIDPDFNDIDSRSVVAAVLYISNIYCSKRASNYPFLAEVKKWKNLIDSFIVRLINDKTISPKIMDVICSIVEFLKTVRGNFDYCSHVLADVSVNSKYVSFRYD